MRLVIANTSIITGDGSTFLENRSIVVEDDRIVDISPETFPYYDPADYIINAYGALTIPGLIDHHVHGLTVGPIQAICQPPLPFSRATYNLDRLLAQGITTALNVDGFPTLDEVETVSAGHPVNVRASTLHTPTYLEWADDVRFGFGTLTTKHLVTTAEDMLENGAVAIGEAGPGSDAYWPDFALIPDAIEQKTGIRLLKEQVSALREAVEAGRPEAEIEAELASLGAKGMTVEELEELVAATEDWREMAQTACLEAASLADHLDVPFILHVTPTVEELVREIVAKNGERVIASHSNLDFEDAERAIELARYVRENGGRVDLLAGDWHGGKRLFDSLDIHEAMLNAGVVDVMSTDYCGGFWDSMLMVLQRLVEAGILTLAEAIALVTGKVHDLLPELSPDRGFVEPGKIADLVVVDSSDISQVRNVIVAGEVVVSNVSPY